MKTKRFLSFFMCLALMLSMIPYGAFALEETVLPDAADKNVNLVMYCFNIDEGNAKTTYFNFKDETKSEVANDDSIDLEQYANDVSIIGTEEEFKLILTIGDDKGYLSVNEKNGNYEFSLSDKASDAQLLSYDADADAIYLDENTRLCFNDSFIAADTSETSEFDGLFTSFIFYEAYAQSPVVIDESETPGNSDTEEQNPLPSSVSVSPKNKVYDGKAYSLSASDYSVTGDGAVTIKYYSDSSCANEISAPVNAGTYYVKVSVAATENYTAASAVKSFSINRAATTVSVTVQPGIVGSNSSITITAKASHSEASQLEALVSWEQALLGFIGTETVELDPVILNHKGNGVYVGTLNYNFNFNLITQIKGDINIKVTVPQTTNHFTASASTSVIVDNTAPIATITIDSIRWMTLIPNPTFNIYYNTAKSGSITASDSGSGVDHIYYYISSTVLTQSNLEKLTTWTEGTSFTISSQGKYIVYAKVVDKTGNVSYISTNGIVIDSTAPKIESVENGKAYYDGVTFTVNEEYLSSVTVNGTAITPTAGSIYSITADATKEKTIVATDKAGNTTTITITLLANPSQIAITTNVTGSLVVGEKLTLAATVSPDYAYDKSVKWSSSNNSIATIDSKGVVTAKAQGTVTITATSVNGITKTKTVKVIPKTVRLSGTDRVATSLSICSAGWTKTNNVIIANGRSFADALAAGPLAYKLDAPILLTMNDKEYLDASIMFQISKLGAKNIYLIGGTGVINSGIESILKNLYGYNVIRIAGSDRFGTAVAIAKRLDSLRGKSPTDVYIVNGMNYPDALSISTVAALKNAPILFTLPATSSNTLHATTSAYLKSISFNTGTVIGGAGAISNNVLTNLKSCGAKTTTRISGKDRYLTSAAIYDSNKSLFTKNHDFAFATGTAFPDALSGSVFAAKKGIPIFLVGPTGATTSTKASIQARLAQNLYVFGGPGAVADSLINTYLG